MKTKIRKGDKVEVISGKPEYKGMRGEVIKVNPDEEQVVVQGVNLQTKHQRQVQAQGRSVSGKCPFRRPHSFIECDAGVPEMRQTYPGILVARRR